MDARLIEKGCREVVCLWKSFKFESAEQCEGKSIKSHSRSNSVFAQFSVVCIFNWMLGQLRRVIERSYIRGRAPNLNRLNNKRKSIKPHPRPNSIFAQFSIVYIFNWMLGQLRKAVGRSFFEGRSHIRGKTPNLNRLNNLLTERDI